MPDIGRLRSVVEAVLDESGVELVDLEVGGQRGRPLIRVYADTDRGITLDQCARLSRALEPRIEAEALVPERYVLEVSSPGIDRPLTRASHYQRFKGRDVEVRLYAARDGRKKFVGLLDEIRERPDGFAIVVRDPASETQWTFDDEEIARARLHVNWDGLKTPDRGRQE